MQITQMWLPSSKYRLKSPYAMTPKGIVYHNTGNDASAMSECSYMIGNSKSTSFHYAIDDYRVVQSIPDNRNAWHCGNSYGNKNYIGIEGCYSRSGGSKFDAQEKLSAQFIAMKLKEYGWGLDRLFTHQSQSGKYCPSRTLDYGWQRFRQMVQTELNKLSKPKNDPINNEGLYYRAHVQSIGDQTTRHDGQYMGEIGKRLRLESFFIDFRTLEEKYGKLIVNIKTHIQSIGWVLQKNIQHNTLIGTKGKSLRIEALEIEVIGLPKGKILKYQVHLSDTGWTPAVTSGFATGSVGLEKAIEAIRIWVE